MRLILTALAYLGSLAVVAGLAFAAVILLVGPHGGLLPRAFQRPVLILGWLCVLLALAWIARLVWRRLGRLGPPNDLRDD